MWALRVRPRLNMCAGYGLELDVEAYREVYGLDFIKDLPLKTIIRPTDTASIIVLGDHEKLELRLSKWGFNQPANCKSKLTLWNARDDRLLSAPTWRESFRSRRCIVPATAFFEHSGPKGQKTRHAFSPSHARVFSFAGLWQDDRFTIITTTPNATVADYHDRMPVILKPRDVGVWLEPGAEVGELMWLCKPYLANRMAVTN
jgi:putative SOS response-associated peptidase YedK